MAITRRHPNCFLKDFELVASRLPAKEAKRALRRDRFSVAWVRVPAVIVANAPETSTGAEIVDWSEAVNGEQVFRVSVEIARMQVFRELWKNPPPPRIHDRGPDTPESLAEKEQLYADAWERYAAVALKLGFEPDSPSVWTGP